MKTSPDLCEDIADFVVGTRYDKLSNDAVEGAKKSILDMLGVILAGAGMEPAARAVVELAMESSGRPESSVLGFGGRVPAVTAAFANGAMAHSLDFDDLTPWGQHAGSSLIPPVFAIAEKIVTDEGTVSGQDMIAAIAAGQDLFNRFRRFLDWRKDWNFSTVMGVYCGTAACAYLLRLPKAQVAHALGIASLQSSGTSAVINAVGTDLRGIYAGFSARGAVTAALLAQKGITGIPGIFEGRHGIFEMYFGNRYDRKSLVNGLGKIYTGGSTLYKRWPSVGTAHSHIHATIELMKEHNLDATDIDKIRIFVGDYHRLTCDPLETRRAPAAPVEAKFSLPFLVAIAAVRRDMSFDDFTEDAIKDPRVLAAARMVEPIDDASLDWKLELPPGRVEIVMRDGRRFERVGTRVPGGIDNPMLWDDLVRKFLDCASRSPTRRSADQLAEVTQAVRGLEGMRDATAILRMLS